MKNVLLVEPNKKIAKIIKQFLETNQKLKVYSVHSAQDAIIAADNNKPDVVILELAIPMHNGFAFLHEFRSYNDWSNIPVVIHSHLSRDEAELSKSWKILGTSKYLYKPQTSLAKLKTATYEALDYE